MFIIAEEKKIYIGNKMGVIKQFAICNVHFSKVAEAVKQQSRSCRIPYCLFFFKEKLNI